MTDKIRKRLRPVSVVATIAVLGLLAAFIALAALPDITSAQGRRRRRHRVPGTPPAPPAPPSGDGPPAPPPAPPVQQTAVGGMPDSYIIEGPNFVDQGANMVSEFVLVVEDQNGLNPNYSMGGNDVTIRFTRHDQVPDISEAGDIQPGVQCLPDDAALVDLDLQTMLLASATCTIAIDLREMDRFSIAARSVPHNRRVGISLSTMPGNILEDTHTLTFLNPQAAIAPPEPDPIEVATTGCNSIVGYPDENRDDLADPTIASVDAEIGQDTVQVLNGMASVQLTVTSCQEGPVYIRFLDSNGDVFGTDVDECETCPDAAGADVVGLDSQGRLELNLKKDYTAAEALMYDQYTLISINPGTANPMERLAGKPGQYYQGKFRFYAPCEWGPFQVQVHEPSGKVLQELQNGMMRDEVSCVPAEQAVAQPIEVVQGSRADREMLVRWQPIADAVKYTVAVLDTSDPAMYTVTYVEMFDASATRETTVTGLTSGTRYYYVVYAELPGRTYSPAELVINTPEF